MTHKLSLTLKLITLALVMCGTRMAFAHAGHGEPHGAGAHPSDFMSYVIGFIAVTAFVKCGGMGIAQHIKAHASNSRALILGSLCTASILVFIYWFTQV